jgi:hypothetical protein
VQRRKSFFLFWNFSDVGVVSAFYTAPLLPLVLPIDHCAADLLSPSPSAAVTGAFAMATGTRTWFKKKQLGRIEATLPIPAGLTKGYRPKAGAQQYLTPT